MSTPEKNEKHEKAAKPDAPPSAPTPKALLALVGANLLVTIGLAAVVVVTRPGPAAAAPAQESAQGEEKKAEHGEEKSAHGEEKKAEHGEEKPAEHGEEKPAEKKAEHGEEKKAEHGSKGDDDAVGGSTARLEDIIVHLRNPEVDRYARLTLDVEMADPSQIPQLQQRTPQIRDTVITALSEETFESLRGADGLIAMKEKLRQRIDAVVPGEVRALYVSGFIVQ